MSVVRDPEVAARYAADPAGTLADAHLPNVTSVDVNNLIPMVSDSLSMASPATGLGGGGVDSIIDGGNVWTSGAATAAFDAFTGHVPDAGAGVLHDVPSTVIDTGMAGDLATDLANGLGVPDLPHAVPALDDFSQVSDGLGIDPLTVDDPAGWEHGVIAVQHEIVDHPADGSGFDLF